MTSEIRTKALELAIKRYENSPMANVGVEMLLATAAEYVSFISGRGLDNSVRVESKKLP